VCCHHDIVKFCRRIMVDHKCVRFAVCISDRMPDATVRPDVAHQGANPVALQTCWGLCILGACQQESL
jgi:hypothetical protein